MRGTLSRLVVQPSNPRSVSARARRKRWDRFFESFPDITEMRVLDLGGTPDYWRQAPQTPRAVTVVNLGDYADGAGPGIEVLHGDACDPPSPVRSTRYDLVVSNSLLEHVGGHAQRLRLAEVIRSGADRHWVQTPYRYFPVEPHWLCPGIQFLPFEARIRLTQVWPLGHMQSADRAEALAFVEEIELLCRAQMSSYFPDSVQWTERMAGLPKSLVAIRG